jgi:ribosomal protein S18 acetylase RimI-like enzyme
MSHVRQIGTFLLPAWRRHGVGHALFRFTQAFARDADYSKFVIQVRASNSSAQAFYKSLGFRECGRFSRQVRIDDQEDDEIMMEYFL